MAITTAINIKTPSLPAPATLHHLVTRLSFTITTTTISSATTPVTNDPPPPSSAMPSP